MTVTIPAEYEGKTLLEALTSEGIFLDAPCGGRGKCGKCSVRVLEKSGWKIKKSCRETVGAEPITVEVPDDNEIINAPLGSDLIAIDIGTTSIEAVYLKDYREIGRISRPNPQRIHGADVVSRVSYATENPEGLSVMRREIRKAVSLFIGNNDDAKVVIVGNTVMLHIFHGKSPEKLGVFPFEPEFTESITEGNITTLPLSSAFIGADAVAVSIALGFGRNKRKELLLDLGTNGEIILNNAGKLSGVSTAAGPCFEGASIECGSGAVNGAINKIMPVGSTGLEFVTIGNGEAHSICGAGLIDLIAILLDRGIIDSTGFLAENYEINGISNGRYAETNVFITPSDVRAVQKAVAAVRAATEILIRRAGIAENDLDAVYIAGNMGNYMNPVNAAKVGIISKKLAEKTKMVGNAALTGAIEFARNPHDNIKIETIMLNDDNEFNDIFIRRMNFND